MPFGISFVPVQRAIMVPLWVNIENVSGLQDGNLTESLSAIPIASLNMLNYTR